MQTVFWLWIQWKMKSHRFRRFPLILHTDESSQEKVLELLGETAVSGLCGAYVSSLENDLHTLKETCEKAGDSGEYL